MIGDMQPLWNVKLDSTLRHMLGGDDVDNPNLMHVARICEKEKLVSLTTSN